MFCSNCGKFFEGTSELCPDCENANVNANDFTTPVQDADASAFDTVENSVISEVKAAAKSINTLGIISLITGIIGFCCSCTGLAALITGIIGLIKKAPAVDTSMLSEAELADYESALGTIKKAKIFSIVGVVLSVLAVIFSVISYIVIMATGVLESAMYY